MVSTLRGSPALLDLEMNGALGAARSRS